VKTERNRDARDAVLAEAPRLVRLSEEFQWRASAALGAAVRIGLFDLLDREPLEPDEIADRLGLRRRGIRLLVRVLTAMAVLIPRGVRLDLAEDVRAFLVRGREEYLGGLIDLEVDHYLEPRLIVDALRRDGASVYGDEDPWQAHAVDPERARAFTDAMHSISMRPASALASAIDLSRTQRLLDVGGGSGAIAIALARAWPNLRCLIWDLRTVCDLARGYVSEAKLGDRVEVMAGDIFDDPVPPRHDAVLLSQILHDWSPETGARLVARLFDALLPGGQLFVHEKLISDDGPLANALVDLDMLVWTEGQQWSEGGLRDLLGDAGFEPIGCRRTTGYWSVVTATKPRPAG